MLKAGGNWSERVHLAHILDAELVSIEDVELELDQLDNGTERDLLHRVGLLPAKHVEARLLGTAHRRKGREDQSSMKAHRLDGLTLP